MIQRVRSIVCVIPAMIGILTTGCDRIFFGEATSYSRNFSEQEFSLVQMGMSKQEVVRLLGEPLSVRTQHWTEVYVFDQRESPTGSTEHSRKALLDRKVIRIDEHGLVESAEGPEEVSKVVGLSRHELTNTFGIPKEVRRQVHEIVFHYSKPNVSGSGTYKRREIAFDLNEIVFWKNGALYYD